MDPRSSSAWFPTKGFGSPTVSVTVDPGAVRRNLDRYAARFDPGVSFIPSIKKDAYGHGIVEVARALADHPRVEAFGVFSADEAIALREAGVETPILIQSVLPETDLLDVNCHPEILPTITSAEEAEVAVAAARLMGGDAVRAHLKIDTGMGRLGRTAAETLADLARIAEAAGFDDDAALRVAAVYTHLADGWHDPESARRQWRELIAFAEAAGLQGARLHVGGGDAISLADRIPAGASVRVGIPLYGYHPAVEGLEPAMTMRSRVIYRRSARAGARISYGGTRTLTRDSELALVGAGYGSGYPRSLSDRGEVLLRGRRRPVLGRVCMDQIVVDVTDAPDVAVGDEAVLFGEQAGARIGADEVAERAGTIAYEILTVAGRLNPRSYEE